MLVFENLKPVLCLKVLEIPFLVENVAADCNRNSDNNEHFDFCSHVNLL